MKTKYLFYAIIFTGFLSACGDDEDNDPKAILQAVAGDAQTVSPFTEVTLDGSASTGKDGFRYEWIYKGSKTITLSSTNEAIVTFTPEVNGSYNFTLRITLDGEFSEAQTTVTVTGAVVLDASSFTSDRLTLTNIEPNGTGPDYMINADFTIPEGKLVKVENGENVTIGIADGVGIIINGALYLSNQPLTLMANNTGWKGILVDGGVFVGGRVIIDKAGSTAFDGQEAAALTFVNDGSLSSSDDFNLIISKTISDLGMVLTSTTSGSWSMSNGNASIDAAIPVKAPIGYLRQISRVVPADPSNYNYFHLTTRGAGVTEGSTAFNFTHKYFIDGDFTAGSRINISDATIFMKEGTGIVGIDMSINSTTIEGLNGASWKGIAASGYATLSEVTITGAGSATHNTGAFTSAEKAAVYGSTVRVSNCNITNSDGYGVYLTSQSDNTQVSISSTVFANTVNNDVSLPFGSVGSIIRAGNTWSTNTPVALRATSRNTSHPWLNLGDGISYLATENLTVRSSTLVLNPGVSIKFQSGTGLTVNTGITAKGTSAEAITFEGVGNTPGSWNGISMRGRYQMEYCTINNGGQAALAIGAEKANVLFNSHSSFVIYPQMDYSFENNTVSNSAGYGVQVFLRNYDPVTSATTNTYTNNASGDIKLP